MSSRYTAILSTTVLSIMMFTLTNIWRQQSSTPFPLMYHTATKYLNHLKKNTTYLFGAVYERFNRSQSHFDDMRGDSRGAVLTTRTHTLSRSLTIFCPRFGLTRFVPEPLGRNLPVQQTFRNEMLSIKDIDALRIQYLWLTNHSSMTCFHIHSDNSGYCYSYDSFWAVKLAIRDLGFRLQLTINLYKVTSLDILIVADTSLLYDWLTHHSSMTCFHIHSDNSGYCYSYDSFCAVKLALRDFAFRSLKCGGNRLQLTINLYKVTSLDILIVADTSLLYDVLPHSLR
ncbi:hypothetical protein J6590_099466 [Homalodisca vitripennis]|nr:hypothetical protein J6590_099466 [Homalodisca vitripennis]